jgi:TonB family protein
MTNIKWNFSILNSHLLQSFLIHLMIALIITFFLYVNDSIKIEEIVMEKVEINIVEITKPKLIDENIKPAAAPIEIKKNEMDEKQNKKFIEQKKIFGIQKNTLTNDSAEDSNDSVASKTGNTLAKLNDDLKMSDEDSAKLPNPTAEYLVTQMPVLKKEVRPHYPPEAKKMGLFGKVFIDILIDEKGKVVKATLVKGIHPLLDNEALTSIKQYQFSPAKVDKKSVAVKINYAINFILED